MNTPQAPSRLGGGLRARRQRHYSYEGISIPIYLPCLPAANHKWAVKIVEDAGMQNGFIGLLPKLSDAQVAQMEGVGCMGSTAIGGWGMGGNGGKYGNWECPNFTFDKGETVVCDLNFAAKTLTLSCGDSGEGIKSSKFMTSGMAPNDVITL